MALNGQKQRAWNLSCNELMQNNQGHIDVSNNGKIISYCADKAAVDKARALSDEDFEREIASMPPDMQTFLRFMRK